MAGVFKSTTAMVLAAMLGIFLLNAAANEVVEPESKQDGEGPASMEGWFEEKLHQVENTVSSVLHQAVEEIKAEVEALEASEGFQNLEHQAEDLGERFMKSAHDVEEATEEVLHEAIEKAKEPGQDLKDSVTGSEHHQEEENPAHGSSHQAEDLGESFMKSAHGVEEAKEEVLHEAIEKAKEPGQDLKDSVTGSEHHQEEKPAQDAKEEL